MNKEAIEAMQNSLYEQMVMLNRSYAETNDEHYMNMVEVIEHTLEVLEDDKKLVEMEE